ncbi:MAG: hypothetical protein HY791_21615 [Deltaproteobacteria bacterium]|nr:hypothetical protein [Deltaproteobacteria bacterium]
MRTRHGLAAWVCIGLAGVAPVEALGEDVSLRPTLELFGAVQGAGFAVSSANPDNSVLKVPFLRATTELRPDLKLEVGDLTFRARARIAALSDSTLISKKLKTSDPMFESQWLDLYGEWRVSDSVIVAYGLHNFEWGPAESTSPSNGLVRNPAFASTFLTTYPGRHLGRINFSAGRSFSAVFMVETMESAATSPLEPFDPKGQLKLEYASEDGAFYVGAVAGVGKTWRPWVGEYLSIELFEGFSAYLDGRETLGSRSFYPLDGAPSFEQNRLKDNDVSLFLVGGVRYAFEDGADLRLELIRDDAAYTTEELDRSVSILAMAGGALPILVGPYVSPGTDLPGKNSLYASLRVPNLGPGDAFQVSAREVLSLTDATGISIFVIDWAATDSLVLDLTGAIFHGKRDGELTRLLRGLGLLAAKYSW